MPTSTLTSKGQVTVPKAVRERLGLRPGHQLSFEIEANGRILVRVKTVRLESLAGLLRRRGAKRTLRDLEKAIGRGAVESFQDSVK